MPEQSELPRQEEEQGKTLELEQQIFEGAQLDLRTWNGRKLS